LIGYFYSHLSMFVGFGLIFQVPTLCVYNHWTTPMYNLVSRTKEKINVTGIKRDIKIPRSKPGSITKSQEKAILSSIQKAHFGEYDACTEPGEKGALLRKEGIYSSYIPTWKRQLERRDNLVGSTSAKRGPKEDPQREEMEKLEKENERLRERLRQSELIIEAQKKISQILGLEADENDEKI